MRGAALALAALCPISAAAFDGSVNGWRIILPPVTEGDLALDGWRPGASAGLSWPDGRQATVTYWTREAEVRRCVVTMGAEMQAVESACYRPAERSQ